MLKTLLSLVTLSILSTSAFSQRSGVWHIIPYPATQNFGTGQQKLISAANSKDIATITDATDGKFQHEVRVSHDSGNTWKILLAEDDATRWSVIHHPMPSTYLVVGDSDQYLGRFGYNDAYKLFGLFYFSSDSGLTWKKTLLDSNTIVYSGYMQNELEGALVVGYVYNVYDSAANQPQDSLLTTTDGWKTWTSHGLPPGGKACWHLVGLGKESYLACSYYPNTCYVTTDNGVHWDVRATIEHDGITYGVDRITAITPEHLVAVGGAWNKSNAVTTLMYETFDQAKTWIVRLDTVLGTTDGFTSVSFSEDKLHGVAMGSSIVRTEDGGVTWHFDDVPYEVGLYPYPVRDVYCASANFALGVMDQNSLMRFDGKTTLRAPTLHDHEPGPLPLGPTQIAWTPIEGATRYRLQVAGYTLDHSTYDTTVYRTPLLDTLVSDTALLFNAQVVYFDYYVRVEAVNDTEHSTWNERAGLFYTVSSPGKKLPPKIVSPANAEHFSDSVTLAWTPVDGATSYEVKLWLEFAAPVVDTVVTSTSVTVRDLEPPYSYAVQIRAFYEQDSTDWSNGDFYFYMDALSVPLEPKAELAVFPNPTQGELHVKYTMPETNEDINIFDYMGRRLSVPHRKEAGEMVFDLRSLPSGAYLLVIEGKERIIRHINVIH